MGTFKKSSQSDVGRCVCQWSLVAAVNDNVAGEMNCGSDGGQSLEIVQQTATTSSRQ